MCRNVAGTNDQYHSCCESFGVVISSGTMGKGLNATASLSLSPLPVLLWMIRSLERSSYAHSIANPNCTSAACAVESNSIV